MALFLLAAGSAGVALLLPGLPRRHRMGPRGRAWRAPAPAPAARGGPPFPASQPAWVHDSAIMDRFARRGRALPPAGASARAEELRGRLEAASVSQGREDVFAFEHFFFGVENGTFLELGALDGVRYSNSYALDRQLGWKGVLIEASPPSYARLALNRPQQITVLAAVCDVNRTVHYLVRVLSVGLCLCL